MQNPQLQEILDFDDSQELQIQKILDKKVFNGKTLYLIKWKNYPLQEATWECNKLLAGSKSKLKEFKRQSKSHDSTSNVKIEAQRSILYEQNGKETFKRKRGRPRKVQMSNYQNISRDQTQDFNMLRKSDDSSNKIIPLHTQTTMVKQQSTNIKNSNFKQRKKIINYQNLDQSLQFQNDYKVQQSSQTEDDYYSFQTKQTKSLRSDNTDRNHNTKIISNRQVKQQYQQIYQKYQQQANQKAQQKIQKVKQKPYIKADQKPNGIKNCKQNQKVQQKCHKKSQQKSQQKHVQNRQAKQQKSTPKLQSPSASLIKKLYLLQTIPHTLQSVQLPLTPINSQIQNIIKQNRLRLISNQEEMENLYLAQYANGSMKKLTSGQLTRGLVRDVVDYLISDGQTEGQISSKRFQQQHIPHQHSHQHISNQQHGQHIPYKHPQTQLQKKRQVVNAFKNILFYIQFMESTLSNKSKRQTKTSNL